MSRLPKRILIGLTLVSAAALLLFSSLPLPGTIPVLMYHYVSSEPDGSLGGGNWVSRKSFDYQMNFLKKSGYRVLTMDDYYAIQSGHRKPQGREVLITFDDGHRSFKNEAFPILKNYRLPATMFLISDSVKKGGLEGYADSLTAEEIRQLQKNPGISFHGHTKTHPHLKELADWEIEIELGESKKALEAMLGRPVDYLSYPFGEFDRRIIAITEKSGYKLAFSTSFKQLEAIPEGPYSMTRVKISRSSDYPVVFWYHVAGLHQMIKGLRQKMKYHLGWRK